MLRFRRFLAEGGNVKVGEIQAQHIDLTKVDRKKMVDSIVSSLLRMNQMFEKKFGIPLWSDTNYIKNGKVFSGSSEHFINLTIPDEEFVKAKPRVGDIDVQVDKNLSDQVDAFLVKGLKMGQFEYVGRSATAIGQISALFKTNYKKEDLYVQMDFEFVDFNKLGMPTDWSRFSRSSSWEDIKVGVKGVFHKYLFGSIDFAHQTDVIVLKGKREKAVKEKIHALAFSAAKGLRYKYEAVIENGKIKKMNGLPVFKELSTKDAKSINNLRVMFQMLFAKDPSKKEIGEMGSFTGLIQLIKKNFSKQEQKRIVDEFIARTVGKGAQKLYRGDPVTDLQAKSAAINYLVQQLGYKPSILDKTINDYYSVY